MLRDQHFFSTSVRNNDKKIITDEAFYKQKKNVLVLFLTTMLSLHSCNKTEQNTQDSPQTIEAEVLPLQIVNAQIDQSFRTNLQGKTNIELRPQISGYIDKIYVDEGAYVQSGQPIFRINATVYREQKNTALASLEMARSQLATAELELDKYKVLSNKKVVADFQHQKAKTAYQNAKASVQQQQTLVASADVNIGFAVIKAPVNGYIGRIPNRLGALVGPTDARPLNTLSQAFSG